MKLKRCTAPRIYPKPEQDRRLDAYPHYMGEFHNEKPHTIYGKPAKNLTYINSDDINKEDPESAAAAARIANASGVENCTQRWFEQYISAYLGQQVALKHIQVGFHPDGKSYRVYGYRIKRTLDNPSINQEVQEAITEIIDISLD